MDSLSMAAGIGDHIGALEWGDHLTGHGDGVLETAARANSGPTYNIGCTLARAVCASDEAMLRAADIGMSGPQPTMQLGCTRF